MCDTPDAQHQAWLDKRTIWPGLFLLACATLAFEINLTRLFSVSQFYHFAFMTVSVALLGYGASGTLLAIFPHLQQGVPSQILVRLALASSASILGAYLLTNYLPFDSYSLVWDNRQVFILILHYVALAIPFFFSGMALGMLLSRFPTQAGSIYSVNLLGSAAGCVVALLAPAWVGGEGMVTLSSLLAVLAALFASRLRTKSVYFYLGVIFLFIFSGLDLSSRLTNRNGLRLLELHISPYKSLSYALQVPDAEVVFQGWNAFSRVDILRSPGIHSLPGLSYRYLEQLPKLGGLFVDGDDLNPVIQHSTDPQFTAYLPNAVAFEIHPFASTLILGPRGGLDILTTFAHNNGWVAAVELNPLIIRGSPVYEDVRLILHQESERSFLQRWQTQYDVIILSLVSSFHPVQSGAYTLAEDYRYTLEAFQEMLDHLTPEGVLVATRWLQDPPSEDLRLFALAVSAVETTGGDPYQQIVSFRGYNTTSILVKKHAFTPDELDAIRLFTSQRSFDLSYAPNIEAGETNRFNILPQSTYYSTYLSLLQAEPRESFFDAYAYDVRPPTDDHPFFGHYFKWEQAPQVLALFGKAWLPFGGGGYFVILALLILAVILAGVLILLPVWMRRLGNRKQPRVASPFLLRNLTYFGLLGLAFLLVEVPLLQRFILYLGYPAYALTTVLFALLFFSGMGSRLSGRLPLKPALVSLVILVIAMPLLLPLLFELTLGLPLAARLVISVMVLAPAGFLMGIPFPAGLRLLTPDRTRSIAGFEEAQPRSDIAWVWAVNGAASVIAPILAALLALSFGFRMVLWVGAACYAGALLTVVVSLRRYSPQLPDR